FPRQPLTSLPSATEERREECARDGVHAAPASASASSCATVSRIVSHFGDTRDATEVGRSSTVAHPDRTYRKIRDLVKELQSPLPKCPRPLRYSLPVAVFVPSNLRQRRGGKEKHHRRVTSEAGTEWGRASSKPISVRAV